MAGTVPPGGRRGAPCVERTDMKQYAHGRVRVTSSAYSYDRNAPRRPVNLSLNSDLIAWARGLAETEADAILGVLDAIFRGYPAGLSA
jgi:hypothetical protein